MNWVGGVRNRLKSKDEKRRQKEFFDKMRYGSKVKRLKQTHGSPKKTSIPTSLDLLSLQAADYSADKFRKSDSEKTSKSKVKKVEMDRSRGLFPFHHHHQELTLSPDGVPSKLQLQEPDEREYLQASTYTISSSSANRESLKSTFYLTDDEGQPELSGPSQLLPQSSSQFHSTPMTDDVPTLKHQGKHFEDLFFSFVPPGSDTETLVTPKEQLPSAPSEISDDWKSMDEFDYSPLYSVPSESSASDSASSSPRIVSQDSQEYLMRNVLADMKTRCFNADTLANDDEDTASRTSHITVREDHRAGEGQNQNHDMDSLIEMVDLICPETDDFLSPSNKRGNQKSTSGHEDLALLLGTHQDVGLSEFIPEEKAAENCQSSNPGTSSPPQGLTNSFKWNAFVSGHTFAENPPTLNKKRHMKQTPTKNMSSVCKQVLKEVLQLDRELCQNSPHPLSSTSKSGSLSSMMDIINIPLTKSKPKMEEFSNPITKEAEFSNKQTRDEEPDNQHLEEHTHDEEMPLLTHSSASDPQHSQKEDEDNSNSQGQDLTRLSQDKAKIVIEGSFDNPASCEDNDQSSLETSLGEPSNNTCLAITPNPDKPSVTVTDSYIHSNDKSTQCNMYSVSKENKQTQYTVTDCSAPQCDETKTSTVPDTDISSLDPAFLFDTYDGCMIA